jgi:alpha-1,2-mannosyltransferase
MPSAISGITARIHGRTALVVGFLVLAASVALWLPATGILTGKMIDLDTYYQAATHSRGAESRIYTQSFGTAVTGPFLYPPFAAAIVIAVKGLGFTALCWILSGLSAVSLLTAVYVFLRALQPTWDRTTAAGWTMGLSGLALWLDPVERTFTFGQVSLILLALVAVDLTRPDSNRWKGVGVGLAVAIKLTPAIFVLYLLLSRRFRATLVATAVFLGTVVLGWLALPIASPKFWFGALTRDNDRINDHTTVGDSTSQSLRALLYRFLHTPQTRTHAAHDSALLNPLWLLLCLAVVIAGFYAALKLRRRGDELGAIIVVAAVGLLVSPISWTHHWVWTVPALLVLGHRAAVTHSRRLIAALVGASLLFLAYPMQLIGSGNWDTVDPGPGHKHVAWRPYSVVWSTPHQDGREFHWNLWQFLQGNLYVFAAIAFIGCAAWFGWRNRDDAPVVHAAAAPLPQIRLRPVVASAAKRLRTRQVFEPLLVGSTSAALLFLRLMFPNQVGVADNSDGGRLLCHTKLVPGGSGSSAIQQFASFTYVFKPSKGCAQASYNRTDLPHPAYESSQLILIDLGRWTTRLFGMHSALDLRVLGLIACLLIGTAIGLVFALLRSRPLVRYGVAAALLLVTIDAAFIDFAVSPLSEISGIVGVLYLVVAVQLLVRGGRARRVGLALGLVAGLFLTMAKAQMLLLCVPVAVLLALFPVEAELFGGRLDLTGRVGRRLLPGMAGLALIAGTLALTPAQDPNGATLTKGNFVFEQLLRTSPDPAADLRALGLPADYLALVDQQVQCAPAVMGTDYKTDPALTGITRGAITGFLASHPDRAVRVMNNVAGDFFHVRPTYTPWCPKDHSYTALRSNLGNYAADSGKAPNSVDPIAPVTAAFSLLKGLGLIPLLVLWFAPLTASAWLLIRRARQVTGDGRALAVATALLSVIAVSQFVISAFGDGIDTAKHLNLSVYTTALAVLLGAGAVLAGRRTGTAADGSARPEAGLPEPRSSTETAPATT